MVEKQADAGSHRRMLRGGSDRLVDHLLDLWWAEEVTA
jgi:hypothetical protein